MISASPQRAFRKITAKKMLGIMAIISLSICLLAYLCLLRSATARYFLYKEINYQHLSNTILTGTNSNEQKILKAFNYVHKNTLLAGKSFPDKDAWSSLVMARAVCDQQTWAFGTLLAKNGIPVRLLLLRNLRGESNHAVAEVLTKQGWSLFDPLTGLYFYNPTNNSFATVDEIHASPRIFREHPLYEQAPAATRKTMEVLYEGILQTPERAIRWAPLTQLDSSSFARRLLSSGIRLSLRLGGRKFAIRYQDFYLSHLPQTDQKQPQSLLLLARNYDVLQRSELAEALYRQLIEAHSGTEESRDARFFLARLYITQRRYSAAEPLLKSLHSTSTKWQPGLRYHLSLVYAGLGQTQKAAKLRKEALGSADFLEVLATHQAGVLPMASTRKAKALSTARRNVVPRRE